MGVPGVVSAGALLEPSGAAGGVVKSGFRGLEFSEGSAQGGEVVRVGFVSQRNCCFVKGSPANGAVVVRRAKAFVVTRQG